MKKLAFILNLSFLIHNSFCNGQVQTGAISIYNICGDYGIDNSCNESAMYTVFSPMTLVAGAGACTDNCGNVLGSCAFSSPGCAGCTGSATKDHIQAYISVLIPANCTVTIVTEYGAPYVQTASCKDSQMDSYTGTNTPDALSIEDGGTGVNATALSLVASTPVTSIEGAAATTGSYVANIGTCAAGAFGLCGTGTLYGGATGGGSACNTGGCGNSDVICTATGFTGGASARWANLWYMANRSDEIMTYTITPTAGTCTAVTYQVLPIELIAFAASRTDANNITVAWATATETNNHYFMVEYSLDGTTFIPYKEVQGAGNSNSRKDYTCPFTEDIGNAKPYFRLKQVDYNGNYKYSQIIMLGTSYGALKNKDFKLTTYYNTDNASIVSKFTLDAPAQVSISLYDVTGREVYAAINPFNEGDNQFLIPAPDASGVYVLVYQSGSNSPIHKKVIVR